MELTAVVATAMVAAAASSLGCALAARRRAPGSVLTSTVLLVVMVDMALGHVLLLPIVWAALLLALGVFAVAGGCDWRHGLALLAAAVIMIGSPHTVPAAGSVAHSHLHHAGTGPWLLGTVVVSAYVIAALSGQQSSRAELLQVLLTAGCLAAMVAVAL